MPDTVYSSNLNFEWNPASFRVLGVDFTTDLKNIADINIRGKLPEIRRELSQWEKRDLTPFGKITIIKTIILSKIVHLLIALPSPSQKLLNELNTLLYSFLWKGKPDQVKRSVVTQTLTNCGLGMINLEKFNHALKLTWIRKALTSNMKWKEILHTKHPSLKNILSFGVLYTNKILNNTNNLFWKDVLQKLQHYIKNYNLNYPYEIDACSFLYNDNITIARAPIKSKLLIDNNIFYIHQLKAGNSFLSHQEFTTKYNIIIDFLSYSSILNAVKTYYSKFTGQKPPMQLKYQPFFDLLMKTTKGASPIYQTIQKTENSISGQNKWTNITRITAEDWKHSFNVLNWLTKDRKLRWFQYRILHHILSTNRSVSKFKTGQDDACTFCQAHSETILHLLWQCEKTKTFWTELSNLINRRCTNSNNLSINERLVIFGHSPLVKMDQTCNLIILTAKFFIYKCKVKNTQLKLNTFIKELHNYYCVLKYINKNSIKFQNAWAPYSLLFQSLM